MPKQTGLRKYRLQGEINGFNPVQEEGLLIEFMRMYDKDQPYIIFHIWTPPVGDFYQKQPGDCNITARIDGHDIQPEKIKAVLKGKVFTMLNKKQDQPKAKICALGLKSVLTRIKQ